MDLETLNSLLKIGVFVGGICAVGALITETVLNSRQAEVVREMDLRIAEQQERAANAERDAAEAKALAAKAGEGTAVALANAAAVNERAAKLEIEAAAQRERAAKAERSLLTLGKALAPRRLATRIAPGRDNLTTHLRLGKFAGTSFTIQVVPIDEARDLADQIKSILQGSGWVYRGEYTGTEAIPEGVEIRTRRVPGDPFADSEENARGAATLLSEYLEANGLETALVINFGQLAEAGAPLIRVGANPVSHLNRPASPVPETQTKKMIDKERADRIERLRREWGVDF